jgi:hypothetical protein
LAIEVILLLLAAIFGGVQSGKPVVADLVQKISWSTIVCVGVAFGTAATKMRAQVMGLMGFLATPVAFTVARTLHKSATKALEIAGAAPVGPSPVLLAFIKGLEYACLGALIGWVAKRIWGGALAHVTVGLGVGILFGGTILALMDWYNPSPLATAALLSRGVNEILFPVGCSLVLFAAEALGKRVGS